MQVRNILSLPVPRWPFRVANRAIVPLAIMAAGLWRVWMVSPDRSTEFTGTLAVVSVALLWLLAFGYVAEFSERRNS